MVDLPYSGTASRVAHYASRPPVPGVNSDHTTPDPEPDPFNPQPDPPQNQAGTVWADDEVYQAAAMRSLAEQPISHWWAGQNAVPSGEPYGRAQQAMQERMIADHMVSNYVPDGIRFYQNVSEGASIEFVQGRGPFVAGETLPDGSQYLANGRNGYDQTNVPNEVYGGDPGSTGGRYRLGYKENYFGLYDTPLGKFGQDAMLHAYTGLTPTFPAVKTQQNEIAAPYTPNSSGASAYWQPAVPFQAPSLFQVPAETQMTDFAVATDGTADVTSEFDNGGRL